jgi:hypothetical protein
MQIASKQWKSAVTLAAAALCAGGLARAQSLLQTSGNCIAHNGDVAPGGGGATFGGSSTFDHMSLDETGNVMFRARLTGTGVVTNPNNERAYYHGSTRANLTQVIRSGDAAPGLPSLILNTTTGGLGIGGSVRVSPDGDEAFWGGSLNGPGVVSTNDTAIFSGPWGSFSVLVREGDLAVGTVGATYSQSFSSISHQPTGFNRSGRVLFQSSLTGGDVVTSPSNNAAWYSGTNGSLEMVQRKGDVVLGGAIISALGFISQMNDSGQVVHDESLSTTLGSVPATTANDKTLWIWTPGSGNTLLVREGDAAPGTVGASFGNTGSTWSPSVGPNAFNSSGTALLIASLFGGDVVGTTNDTAIYTVSTGGQSLVVPKGDAAPGTPGDTFSSFHTSHNTLNNAGRVAFKGTVAGGSTTTANDEVLFAGLPGSLALIAREGDAAVGTVGATIGAFVSLANFHQNELGQVSFMCDLVGGDTAVGVNDSALYAWDPNTGMHLIGRKGDAVEVQPSVFKTASSFGNIQFNNGDANPIGWNKFGLYAVNLTHPDSTTSLWTVQIPSTPVPVNYCTAGTTTNACTATISASANPDVAHSGACTISVASVEGQKTGLIFYGFAQNNASWCTPGSSFLCVKSPTQRTPSQNSNGTVNTCDGSFSLDWNAYQLGNPTALGNPWIAGAVADVQAWFRDPPACKTTNLSNAVEITYQP